MKGFKRKLSWLLIVSMILGQASFSAFADSDDDDDYDDTEIVLINDLFGGGAGRGRSGRLGAAAPEFKDVKWNELASPSVTWEEDSENTAYYANGKAVTIIASGSNTYIVEDTTGAYTEVNKDKNSFVYGGATASNAQIKSTDITLQGGRVNTIIGSNKYDGTIDQVKITINSGSTGVVYANASSGANKTGIGDVSGASSYADRRDRTVRQAEISVYGGSIGTLLSGNAGYTYTDNLKIHIVNGKIGAISSDENNKWGVFAGGANGEVKNSTVIVDGGEVSALSIGQRAYVQNAVYELNGGKIGEIYAGSWYPEGESFENYKDGTSRGNFHYSKAEKMDISIGQGVNYNGLYAGFHLLDSEKQGALEWLEKGGYGFVSDNYYSDSNKPVVTVSAGASPAAESGVSDWLDGNDMIHNAFNDTKEYSSYMTLNLPKVTAEKAKIEVADGEVAKGTAAEMYVLPGTEVKVIADEPGQDYKFSGWEFTGADLSDDFSEKAEAVTFTMPQGMNDIALKALYTEKGLVLDSENLDLDLNWLNEDSDNVGYIKLRSTDYATPSAADYDPSIIAITEDKDGSGELLGWEVEALKTGETTIIFKAKGSDKILAEVLVKVVDSTPALTVEGGKIIAADGKPVSEGTYGKYLESTDITLRPDLLADKIFTGWKVTGASGVTVTEDNILVMPNRSITVTAQYRDKIFKFADGTKEEVTLNVDQTETNTDKTPDTYTFSLNTDYGTESINVYSANEKFAAVNANEDGSYTIKAVSAGMTTILADLTKDNGSRSMIGITVNVADTTKKTEVGNGKAEINADNAEIEVPEVPEGVDAEKAAELVEEAEAKIEESTKSLAANEAAKEGVSGFDRVSEQALLDAGIPAGASVVIYPKQELKKIETVFEETRTIDPVTNTEIVIYAPVVKRVVFDIKPYAASHSGAGTEKPVSNLRGSFRFRIPVPAAVSAGAKYAKLTHTSDQGGVVSNNQYLAIREENGHKYVDVTTTHFSIFELEFTDSRPSSGNTGGGGGGGSRTTVVTGKWILNATGWWYQYADKTYPANGWAYLTYATNENRWYHFDVNGYMQTGWFTDTDGHRYYLHAVSDGTMGHMYTGWHEIDGKWYYFTIAKTETNPVGSLLVNATTPDGYQVGADGARIR